MLATEKFKQIVEGWKNYIFPNSEVEIKAKKRLEICITNKCCKLTIKNICKVCGCFIPAKVRSLDQHCPLKKW